MALDVITYKASIKAAFLAAQAETDPDNFVQAMDDLAGAIADAGEVFVKSGAVATTVTGTLPAGPVAAVGVGVVT